MPEKTTREPLASCPLCGSDNRDAPPSRFSRPPWIIVDCRDCGFVYLANPPAYERLEEEFAWEKTSQAVTAWRTRASPVRKRASEAGKKLRRHFLKRNRIRNLAVSNMPYPPATLVDIGCGRGRAVADLARELANAGYSPNPLGIEISAELAESADSKLKKLKGRCLHSDALSGLKQVPDGSATLVLMSAYLEHESRPLQVLQESARILRPKGVVVIKVPNYACWNRLVMGSKWCGFRYPDHVNYFTPKSLRTMAEKAGLKIRRGGLGDRLPTSDNMYLVLEKP